MIVEVCGGNNWFAPGPNVNISVVIPRVNQWSDQSSVIISSLITYLHDAWFMASQFPSLINSSTHRIVSPCLSLHPRHLVSCFSSPLSICCLLSLLCDLPRQCVTPGNSSDQGSSGDRETGLGTDNPKNCVCEFEIGTLKKQQKCQQTTWF